MGWPSINTVTAARAGRLAEVITIREGSIRGLRSSTPHVVAQVWSNGSIAVCERCGAREKEPDPPASMAPGSPRTSLMSPGTRAHSTYLLTWLHAFEAGHQDCKEAKYP